MDCILDSKVVLRRLRNKLFVAYLALLLLIISSIYFLFFIEPTSIFYQKGILRPLTNLRMNTTSTNQKALDGKTIDQCQKEMMNNTATSSLDIEIDIIQRQMNSTSSGLCEMANLFVKEMRKEKNRTNGELLKAIQKFDAEMNILESKLAVKRDFLNYTASSLRNTSYPGVEIYTRYAVARLEMLPLPLAQVKPLKPEFGPVINNVTSLRYPISVPSCAARNSSKTAANSAGSVFIAVISAPGNFKKRSVIRKTWPNHIQTVVVDKGLLTMVRYAFILGQPENQSSTYQTTQTQIEEESKTFGDIIQIEMSDYYRNLALKVAGLLNWLDRNCANVLDFVFKVDDDVYVNMHNLAKFVQSHRDYNRSVFGIGFPNGNIPDRGGKWSITYEEWPWNRYPKYFLGGAVLIHASSILPLLAACQTVPMIPFDDLYLFGMCTEKAGIKIYFSSGSTSVFINNSPDVSACKLRTLIAKLVHIHDDIKFQEVMNLAHGIADKFYSNTTQCILTDSKGLNSSLDYSVLVEFNFHNN